MPFALSRRTRFPFSPMANSPNESLSGLFLFATHTTTSGVMILYHIPMYLFLELTGEKKPSSKVWPEDTKVVPSLIDWIDVIESSEKVNSKKKSERDIKKMIKKCEVSITTLRCSFA